jgi:poly(3-hydroxybutyrate) depolymerase
MRKIYIFITLFVLTTNGLLAQVKTTTVNGAERKYLVFTPMNESSEPRALFLLLHGNGSTAAEFAELCNAQSIADKTNYIVVFPEAMDEQNQELLSLFNLMMTMGKEFPGVSMVKVWNAGVSIQVSDVVPQEYIGLLSLVAPTIANAGKIQFNKDIDDVSYLNQVINEVKRDYKVDENKIYMEGASMGGAMTYKYAFGSESQVDAIAVIAGFIGAEVDQSKALNIPVCIFHSKDDEVVPYNGGIFNEEIPAIVDNITTSKNCGNENSVDFPDIADDGMTVKTTYYDCDASRVWFYEMTGASHKQFFKSDYQTGPNDMDYMSESVRFFENAQLSSIKNAVSDNKNIFFPNPATDFILSSVAGIWNIYNLTGELLLLKQVDADETIGVAQLPSGLYLIYVETEQGIITTKLVKK